ncbi:MAG TPA: PKD domain-containing protein, partial [Ferruginibacter sp.]|nr:PKD domain-containing protein [Ferruginibacter sp.]
SLATAAQQCYRDNQFIFNNTSSVFAGNLLYNWDMGNGTLFNTRDVTYTYPVPGVYNVKLLITAANGGCQDSTTFSVTVYPTPKADYTINQASQCLNNNQFIFTNGSTVFSGGMQYQWDLGDGNTATTQHVTHTYANPGTYTVRLITSGTNGGCSDTISKTATVFAYPVADFLLSSPTCANTPIYVVNKTINTTTTTLDYLWEFGNGQTGNTRTPVYSYPAAGIYKVKLSVNITGCPTPVSTRELDIIVEPAIPGTRYPDFNARYNFPEVLHAQTLGNSVLWTPATNLDNRFSYNPTFKGMHDQLYTIELKNARNGCVTVDTLLVKTQKKIEIYVPTVFTPGGDGVNDLLRPLLFGFDHVNYFRVYNRWGKLLFQMNSDRPGWDGRINGQVTTETQTVVWMIEAVDVDGKTHRKQGTTVLLR